MIFAFCGLKGSGKTTAANLWVDEHIFQRSLRDDIRPMVRDSFAGPLKKACQIIFSLTDDQCYNSVAKETMDERWGMKPREIFQRFGTEVGREFSLDLWLKSLEFRRDPDSITLVDDCRFFNEAEAIRGMGGMVIGIKNPNLEVGSHASESEMVERWDEMVDITVHNDGVSPEFYRDIIRLYDEFALPAIGAVE